MKVVVDTNCFISCIGKRSPYRIVFDSFLQNKYILCLSSEIVLLYATFATDFKVQIMAIILLRLTYAFGLSLLFSCNGTPKSAGVSLNKSVLPQFNPPIISQSAEHLKSGEELKITIQTEPFTDTSNPRVKINGIDIPSRLSDQASTAKYITKVHGTPGLRAITITVTHFIRGNEVKIDSDTVVYTIDK